MNLARVLTRWPLPYNMREHHFVKYEAEPVLDTPAWCLLFGTVYRWANRNQWPQNSLLRPPPIEALWLCLEAAAPGSAIYCGQRPHLFVGCLWLSTEHVVRMAVLAHFCPSWVTSLEDNLSTLQKLLQGRTMVSEPSSANFLFCPHHKGQAPFLSSLLWLHCLSSTSRLLGIPSHVPLAPLNPTLCLSSTGSKLTRRVINPLQPHPATLSSVFLPPLHPPCPTSWVAWGLVVTGMSLPCSRHQPWLGVWALGAHQLSSHCLWGPSLHCRCLSFEACDWWRRPRWCLS